MKSWLRSVKRKLGFWKNFSSESYWSKRYSAGGNSGAGSYGHLAHFKASVLNEFVKKNVVRSVIEFGCGDGNQLTLAKYPKYVGYDVSPFAVKLCRDLFKGDHSKDFFLMSDYDGRRADLAISLDVIFHLVEDETFDLYMQTLFGAALHYVIIYSSNWDESVDPSVPHVRHRCFTKWIDHKLSSEWKLVERIPNAYPYNGDYRTSSFSDFFVYQRLLHCV